MPELPEVEITRRGIEPHIVGKQITAFVVREPRMRWPIAPSLAKTLPRLTVQKVRRRAKYLILDLGKGCLIIHLGMSGSLRLIASAEPPRAHDHVDLVFGDRLLRLRDPRRFGCVLWQSGIAENHPLLSHLGVEPLSRDFSGDYLYRATRHRKVAIKQLLMNQQVVVGVGNIYASECLFRARIRPTTHARGLSRARCEALARAVVDTLEDSLRAGGSTLRDYVQSNGEPGYFQQQTFVYDRLGEPCRECSTPIRSLRQGQRSTFYCPQCQK
ncbi:MAG: bifunctional DNA-formamidopyrimidine glycosylase/DNA-(apurinic or apyrimidinic site) lyase [Betaproteobacteria bacterium]|nr:bifunctional DNA-formamidopyrimidine glycosylase/DNA-(apurinic or apyrimidinic site) lyase [Betaproteobacteria bacterium]